MRQEAYRAQVDALRFRPDFQDRTVARLVELAQEKERTSMKQKHMRIGLVAAALAAALSITAYAAVTMLRPQEVAQQAGNAALAAAFERGDAVDVNETKTVDDFAVTLMGLVNGDRLSGLASDVSEDRTYAVLALARTNGAPVEDDVPELTVTPLVEGYAPWQLNAWTLGGGTTTFAQEGILYYLLECDNVEPFADHTVYLAVYPGTHIPPSAEIFAISDAGALSVQEGAEAALFTLPLDPAKADPQKVASMGYETWKPLPDGGENVGLTAVPGEKEGEFFIVTEQP